MLAPQSRQMVHPAKSHALVVCPMVSQSLPVPVIEYGALEAGGMAFFFLRRRGIFSPHSVSCTFLPSFN